MHENDDIKNEKNPQVTISLTELTLMSFACRWINVHLIVYNIFSAFLLNDTIERFNKIFAAPKHSSTTLHQCTTFSF